MAVRRFAVTVALCAFAASACQPSSATPPSSSPSPSAAAAVALCKSSSADFPAADIAAFRARFPKVTDNRSAYALSLLPIEIYAAAGVVDIVSGSPSGNATTALDAGVLKVRPGTDIAPADIAGSAMFSMAAQVLVASSKLDPVLVSPDLVIGAVGSLTTDTYIVLAKTHPEATWGAHATGDNPAPGAQKRLLPGSGSTMPVGVNIAAFASHRAFYDVLGQFMGKEYYRISPASADFAGIAVPARGAEATALAEAMKACS